MGNSKSVFSPLGATNHSDTDREINDYYATDPIAIDVLIDGGASLSKNIWECSCGEGHLSKRLEELGYNVKSTDLIDRGYGEGGINFFECTEIWDGDILTNPPYSDAYEFVEHALELVQNGHKVWVFLKLTFLEGRKRRKLFDKHCLKTLYVSSGRILCAKSGDFEKKRKQGSAIAYGWYEFEKGYQGDPVIKWIN